MSEQEKFDASDWTYTCERGHSWMSLAMHTTHCPECFGFPVLNLPNTPPATPPASAVPEAGTGGET